MAPGPFLEGSRRLHPNTFFGALLETQSTDNRKVMSQTMFRNDGKKSHLGQNSRLAGKAVPSFGEKKLSFGRYLEMATKKKDHLVD